MKKILIIIVLILINVNVAEARFFVLPTQTRMVIGKSVTPFILNSSQNRRDNLTFGKLIALWSFNGPDVDIASNQVFDRTGSFTGTIVNGVTTTQFVSGAVGQAIRFGVASNHVVSVPDAVGLRPVNPSMSAWFNCSTFASAQTVISKPRTAAPWSSPFTSWLVRINSATSIEFGIATGSYTGTSGTVSAMVANQWYHVVMTYTSGSKQGYLNGVSVSSNAQSGAVSYAAQPVVIGGDFGAAPYGDLANCVIDDVRLYEGVLTPAEVSALFAAGPKI